MAEPDTTINDPAPLTEAEEDADLAADDAVDAEASDAQHRLWMRAILPLLQIPPPAAPEGEEPMRPAVSPAVQSAMDSLVITACARLKRILRSDLAGR